MTFVISRREKFFLVFFFSPLSGYKLPEAYEFKMKAVITLKIRRHVYLLIKILLQGKI